MVYSKRNSETADPQCLRELLGKVQDSKLSGLSQTLVEQVESTKVESIDGKDVLACKMGGCTMRYFVEKEDGILFVDDHDGSSLCD